MSRKPGWMPRDNGLILVAIIAVLAVVAAVVILAVTGRIEPETAIAALAGPGAAAPAAIGRVSGANAKPEGEEF